MRKHVLQYDDVLSTQREVIYRERKRILERANLKDGMAEMLREHLELILEAHIDPDSQPELWEEEGLPSVLAALSMDIPMFAEIKAHDLHGFSYDDLKEKLFEDMMHAYTVREEHIGVDDMREFERQVLLHNIDTKWVDYLHNIDLLREGIQMRAYAQKDPLQEYKREAFNMFNLLLRAIQAESIQHIFRAQPQMSEINNMFEIPEDMLNPENFPEGMTPDSFFAMLHELMEKQMAEAGDDDEETAKHRAYLMEAMQAAEAEHRALMAHNGEGGTTEGAESISAGENGSEAATDTAGGEAANGEISPKDDDVAKIDLNAKTPRISESRPTKNGKNVKPKKGSAKDANGGKDANNGVNNGAESIASSLDMTEGATEGASGEGS
jgi:preprotein translocase subunit SecA